MPSTTRRLPTTPSCRPHGQDGLLSHHSGDTAAAIADLDRALELGDDAALRYNRAVACRTLGRLADALADLDAAVSLDPADPDIEQERLRCHAELGMPARRQPG